MRILIKTPVKGNYQDVLSRFDQDLFEQLAPPGAAVELVRFDGSHKGDIVHIRMTLLGFIQQDWISHIVAEDTTEEAAYFIDEGKTLPFFLKAWKHKHIVENHGAESVIIDDIQFKTPFFLFDYLMYPILYAQFAYRKPIYRKIFS